MAIDFPSSPATNDTYTYNGKTYSWNGSAWVGVSTVFGSGVAAFLAAPTGTNFAAMLPVADLKALLILKSSLASTSGTTIDFTGIPSWANRIIVTLTSVSTNGSSNPLLQLGDSGGVETTSYLCGSAIGASQNNYTTGFGIFAANAANVIHATFILTRVTGNTWGCGMTFGLSNGAFAGVVGGSKTLSDTLDRVRMTTVNGTDTFDAGTISIEVD